MFNQFIQLQNEQLSVQSNKEKIKNNLPVVLQNIIMFRLLQFITYYSMAALFNRIFPFATTSERTNIYGTITVTSDLRQLTAIF